MAVVIQLQRVLQMIEARHMEALKSLGITSRQVAVLEAVAGMKDKPSHTDLMTVTAIDRSTISDIIQRLVRKGYVKRERSKDDRRAFEVHLTAEGKSALKAALKAMKTVEAKGAGVPNIAGLAAAVQACLADTVAVAAE